MNSRETVLAALAHRDPGRVPIDFGAHRSSGIAAMAYPKLKERLGISTGHTYVYDMVQQLAIIEPPVLDALGVDTVEMGRAFLLDDADWKDWVLPDGTPCKVPAYANLEQRGDDWFLLSADGHELGVQKKGCFFFEQTTYPLGDDPSRPIEDDDFSDLETVIPSTVWTDVPAPGSHLPATDEGLAVLAKGAQTLRASTDRAIVGLFGGSLFELSQFLYRMDRFLVSMVLHPDAVMRLTERLFEIHMAKLEKWLPAVGPHIDVILFGDDLGGQNGPLISPDMYRTFYKPFHAKLWKRTKELADVKVMLHSCGSIRAYLPDLIEAGLDAVNPVQVSAKDMDAAGLKRDFGDRLTLWGGGCDTHEILCRATPDAVAEHVRAQAKALSPRGGFVFQQVHNIMADVPIENIVAMFEAARDA